MNSNVGRVRMYKTVMKQRDGKTILVLGTLILASFILLLILPLIEKDSKFSKIGSYTNTKNKHIRSNTDIRK